MFCSFCRLWFETGPFVVVVCGGFGLSFFFVAPFSLLAVFHTASAFNQDVSTWNTAAVTTMEGSKCTLSLSLSVAWDVVEYIRQLEVHRHHKSHTFCSFIVVVV